MKEQPVKKLKFSVAFEFVGKNVYLSDLINFGVTICMFCC